MPEVGDVKIDFYITCLIVLQIPRILSLPRHPPLPFPSSPAQAFPLLLQPLRNWLCPLIHQQRSSTLQWSSYQVRLRSLWSCVTVPAHSRPPLSSKTRRGGGHYSVSAAMVWACGYAPFNRCKSIFFCQHSALESNIYFREGGVLNVSALILECSFKVFASVCKKVLHVFLKVSTTTGAPCVSATHPFFPSHRPIC